MINLIDLITNENLKSLLSKRRMTEELLMELKTSFLFHPSKPAGEGMFQFVYSNTDDGEVLYLFTSYGEYLEFMDDDARRPEPVYFAQLENALYLEMHGVIINPASDNFRIPPWLAFHIIEDIEENNHIYEHPFLSPYVFEDNDLLHDYCKGKKTFRIYKNLFVHLDSSTLYTPILSEENLDGKFENGKVKTGRNFSFFKRDGHYLMYSTLDLLKEDIKGRQGNFYYLIADAVLLTQRVLEFDYNGIILITPEGDFTLPRKSLLKHYETIIRNYKKRDNAEEFAYMLEDD